MNTPGSAKFNMIEQQIRPWEVLDSRVLRVINDISREDFVQDIYKGLAYADCQIPLTNSVSMLPPRIEGRILQSLLVTKTDRVLLLGSGSGYLTACLATLAEKVLSTDTDASLLEQAEKNTAAYLLNNIEFKKLNDYQCDFDQTYDVIAVTGSMETVPENLKRALNIDGRLFVIVGQRPAMQAMLITRIADNEWIKQSLFETDIPALA